MAILKVNPTRMELTKLKTLEGFGDSFEGVAFFVECCAALVRVSNGLWNA